jgi:hypothetical protein
MKQAKPRDVQEQLLGELETWGATHQLLLAAAPAMLGSANRGAEDSGASLAEMLPHPAADSLEPHKTTTACRSIRSLDRLLLVHLQPRIQSGQHALNLSCATQIHPTWVPFPICARSTTLTPSTPDLRAPLPLHTKRSSMLAATRLQRERLRSRLEAQLRRRNGAHQSSSSTTLSSLWLSRTCSG